MDIFPQHPPLGGLFATSEELNILSVRDVTRYLKALLDSDELLSDVWVRGELSGVSRPSSGHLYFCLKDESSQLSGVMWRDDARRLRFNPEDGLKVIVRGSVSVYEARGLYQIYCQEMKPDGVGDLYLAFEQLKAKLAAEGLFESSRKRPIPAMPEKIALVTSPTGAAVHDMVTIMRRRFPRIHLVLVPTLVQGEMAPASIVRSIKAANGIPGVDLIIVGRGGGSMEDLWCFNDETVARAICNSRVPIVSAVGHETDFTIADFVADLRAPTPSAAAELVVPSREDLAHRLLLIEEALRSAMARQVHTRRLELEAITARRAFRHPMDRVREQRQRLDELSGRIEMLTRHQLEARRESFRGLAATLDALSPLAVLGRGYSITRKLPEGKIVRSVNELTEGNQVEILFGDGFAAGHITDVAANERGEPQG